MSFFFCFVSNFHVVFLLFGLFWPHLRDVHQNNRVDMKEEERICTYFAERVAPSVQEAHVFEWDLKQQEEALAQLEEELREEEESLRSLKAEERKVKGDMQELKAIRLSRREKIQRLLATSQPVRPSSTFLFDSEAAERLKRAEEVSSQQQQEEQDRRRSGGLRTLPPGLEREEAIQERWLELDQMREEEERVERETQERVGAALRDYVAIDHEFREVIEELAKQAWTAGHALAGREAEVFVTVRDLLFLRLRLNLQGLEEARLEREGRAVVRQAEEDIQAWRREGNLSLREAKEEVEREASEDMARLREYLEEVRGEIGEKEEEMARFDEHSQVCVRVFLFSITHSFLLSSCLGERASSGSSRSWKGRERGWSGS